MSTGPAEAGFAELGARSNFSFLEGASHPHELVAAARALGHAAIGIADRNSLAGAVRATLAAERAGLRFVVGVRLCLDDGQDYLAWPVDRAGYGRLCRLLSAARLRDRAGIPGRPSLAEMLAAAEGWVAAIIPPEAPDDAFAERLRRDARALRRGSPLPLFCAAQHRFAGDDAARLDRLSRLGAPLLAAGGALFHAPARRRLADLLSAIRLGRTVDALGLDAQRNAESHLKPPAEMARLFRRHPEAVANTLRVAAHCRFGLRELRYEYPEEVLDPGRTAQQTLERRVRAALPRRWPGGAPAKVASQIDAELRLIADKDYAPYFLTVHEIVRFAEDQGILCQGRGSAANSAVCYVLGITAVSPDEHELLFERFLSADRDEPPDIDVDFEHERREEVIQHLYRRYGRDRAALAATLIRFRARSAIRAAGKAMGLGEDICARLARASWGLSEHGSEHGLRGAARDCGLDPDAEPRLAATLALAEELRGFPRHLSTHVGGFVITRGPLVELAVVRSAAMPGRTVVEWDKDDVEALGILKVDVLALGMLSALRRAFDLIAAAGGRRHDLRSIPPDCAETYGMLSRADSVGVFQVESRAQMNMLPRLRPRGFYDLVIEVAIVRPGPIQGDMVHPYLRRRDGLEQPDYPSPELRAVLERTLGVPLFQEQAMRVAIVAAGFSPARADRLRRAMGTFQSEGEVSEFQRELIEGMVARRYPRDFAERCFRQLEGFGSYGFPESHAASFARLVYASAWIKCHHPAAFAAALLNAQPMGFYAPAQLVRDAREHGVAVRPVDAADSDWDCTLEADGDGGPALRLGLRLVRGLRAEHAAALAAARPFRSLPDLLRRCSLPRDAVAALARADAFRSLGATGREALWAAGAVERARGPDALPLFAAREAAPRLRPASAGENTVGDYGSTGLTLRDHPLALLRPALAALGAADIRALLRARQGARLRLAGLVLVRQRPGSAGGVVFFTLEDEHGTANLVLHPPVVERFRPVVLGARLMLAEGRAERRDAPPDGAGAAVVHLVVRHLADRSDLLDGLHRLGDPAVAEAEAPRLPRSRDFH